MPTEANVRLAYAASPETAEKLILGRRMALRRYRRELAQRHADEKPSREKWEEQQADIARWLPLRDQLRHAENELQRCEARRHHHDGPHEIVNRGEGRTRQMLVDSLG